MNFTIVIPAHNEALFLPQTLQSLCQQTLLPKEIIVVNDASTDKTQEVIDTFSNTYSFVKGIIKQSENKHLPGAKIIHAFNEGLRASKNNYDIVCKFDADLIFPPNYLETLAKTFQDNPQCGMAGGFCHIKNNHNKWVLESITGKYHIRGALKAYRQSCFQAIGGLKPDMGWDTADELLAYYHNWEVVTLPHLIVKHLRPTGKSYGKIGYIKQGQAFKKLRHGFILSTLSALKLAWRKKSLRFFIYCMWAYLTHKPQNYLVTTIEGKFVRRYRWNQLKKLLLRRL